MSPLLYSSSATGRFTGSRNRSFVEVIRGDEYPEVAGEDVQLESARSYPEVDHNVPPNLGVMGAVNLLENRPEKRLSNHRLLRIRPWIVLFLVCISVTSVGIGIAVGLAVGIPAWRRNHENKSVHVRFR